MARRRLLMSLEPCHLCPRNFQRPEHSFKFPRHPALVRRRLMRTWIRVTNTRLLSSTSASRALKRPVYGCARNTSKDSASKMASDVAQKRTRRRDLMCARSDLLTEHWACRQSQTKFSSQLVCGWSAKIRGQEASLIISVAASPKSTHTCIHRLAYTRLNYWNYLQHMTTTFLFFFSHLL